MGPDIVQKAQTEVREKAIIIPEKKVKSESSGNTIPDPEKRGKPEVSEEVNKPSQGIGKK